ncbi:Hydroxysteroid 11-beta-dehydrogenase 1-like protein A [Hondaea fermentalgiana]|uniref:Hydroxysteroid 11-beta-dehydrogenase 1-like protein A n=1 Tax=Hondaea fermentalgiana TaxID=2315210 RepID=A0A2R5H256_9STRA|nr:Hydroxysteroid 11-beta-dehydrogenase 1-like protein A [Hondaea fermentalgiana]|eukprot:GBG34464.1 Hydroxysteroid 11-beta-dehydrogenase 1-like protein A [Hondaea fermentalgiana]
MMREDAETSGGGAPDEAATGAEQAQAQEQEQGRREGEAGEEPNDEKKEDPEDVGPLPFSQEDLEAAIRVGEALKRDGDLYERKDMRPLRIAWGGFIQQRARKMFNVKSKFDERKQREMRQRAHDKRILEQRRLRAQRLAHLKALQNASNSALAAIPDGAVDDGINTSAGTAGGAESVVQLLRAEGALADDEGTPHKKLKLDDGDAKAADARGHTSEGGEGANASNNENDDDDEGDLLHRPRSCYCCKARFFKMHQFYDSFCPTCAKLNWDKRFQTCDMKGKFVLVTGGRVKIGYQIALKCLRMGAHVIVTTRFTADAALRFAKEKDFGSFKDRLKIEGLDFRDIKAVEGFALTLARRLDRLDVIINNACQTIRRPPQYYKHLLPTEEAFLKLRDGTMKEADLPPGLVPAQVEAANAVIDETPWHGLTAQDAAIKDSVPDVAGVSGTAASASSGKEDNDANGASSSDATENDTVSKRSKTSASSQVLSSAHMTQTALAPDDVENSEEVFPTGQVDVNGQQIDLRKRTSWVLTLSEVSTAEIVEVLAVNAVAPMILAGKLKGLMVKTRDDDRAANRKDDGRYIVNVSAMEGKFNRVKSPFHAHTNAAKSSLNMVTLTSGPDYAQHGIFMTAVDTGWVNIELPTLEAARVVKTNNFQTPIDEVDAAARVLDPVVSGMLDPEKRQHSVFLKDYHITEW